MRTTGSNCDIDQHLELRVSGVAKLARVIVHTGSAQHRTDRAKLNRLPLRYFDTHTHGDVMSYFTNDMDKMSEAMQYGILRLVTSVVLIVGSVVMMFRFNVVMTLLFLVFTLLSMVVTKLFSGVTLRRARRRQPAR